MNELKVVHRQGYHDAQNAIRGAIAHLFIGRKLSSYGEKHDLIKREVSAILMRARQQIDANDYENFLHWCYRLLQRVAKPYFFKPNEFGSLRGIIKGPDLSLADEIKWVSLRIKFESNSINVYRSYIEDAELATVSDEYSYAIEFIDAACQEVGQNFHGIQLRLALENLRGGLSNQKDYLDELRNKFRHGILSFVAYYTSVRNEDRTTLGRFEEQIDKILAAARYRPDTKAYLRYRLTAKWPLDIKSCANILKVEQSHSIIDIYETFVSLLQHIVENGLIEKFRNEISKALEDVAEVDDFRLEKIRLAFGLSSTSQLSLRDNELLDVLCVGNVVEAYKIYNACRRKKSNDLWSVIYGAIARAHGSVHNNNKPRPSLNTMELLYRVFKRTEDCVPNLNTLVKRALNLSGLPFYRGVYSFSRTVFSGGKSTYINVGFVGLNSRWIGLEDQMFMADCKYDCAENAAEEPRRPSRRLWSAMYQQQDSISTSAVEMAFRAIYYERSGNTVRALETAEESRKFCTSHILNDFISWIELSCGIDLNDKGRIIELIAQEVSKNEWSYNFLPVKKALSGLKWPDFEPHSGNLAAGIALDALWRDSDDDTVLTMLRHAFAYQLRKSTSTKPSEFVDHLELFDKSRLIYYLRYVCIPSRMDMSRAFKSSKQVLDERQNVCASLITIDPDRTETYEGEIYNLTNISVINEGMKLIDSSRIHVDQVATSRWAKKNLQEDYLRYKDLISANIGDAGEYDELIRRLFADIGARQQYYTPDNQADAILTDIMIRLRDEFVQNSDYGLDYYLSKRIRHQSFIGLIRGPLEFAHLITSKDTEFGSYQSNIFWIGKFKFNDNSMKSELIRVFNSFSEKFDRLLIKLKDEKLQICSVEVPSGIFDIVVTSRMLFVARNLIEAGTEFDDFLNGLYLIFWSSLEPSLAEARRIIGDELKTEVISLFDGLRENVKLLVEDQGRYADLSTAINDVSTEVQRNLDEATNWFVKPESDPSRRNFTLHQCIDIAVASASKSHRAFTPDVHIDVSGQVSLQSPDLLVLTDTIFIAMDNIKLRSGIKSEPEVWITCRYAENDDLIYLEIENEISNATRTPANEERIDSIRRRIEEKRFGKAARKEGGSGFLKIASALHHSAGGQVQFGFISDNRFRLEVQLKPTRYTVTVISGAGR